MKRADLMPLPIYLSHRLVERQAQLRKNGKLPWLRPDAKSQVTIRYIDGKPREIDTVVLSTQHHPDIEHDVNAEMTGDNSNKSRNDFQTEMIHVARKHLHSLSSSLSKY